MGYLASFTDAVYALLETVGLYHADSTISQEQGEAGVSTKVNEFPGDIRDGRSLDSAEYSREDRRLGRQRENGSRTVDMKWYVDWVNAQCVQSCDPRTTTNPNCAGLAMRENFLFDSAKRCCKTMIPWKTYDTCTRVGSPDGTLNQVYQDINTPINNWGNVMKDPPVNHVKPPPNNNNRPTSTAQTFTQVKPAPINQQIVPKTSCWRSGMSCVSAAQKFACCGVCSNGVCI
jgi:hypothetical protein